MTVTTFLDCTIMSWCSRWVWNVRFVEFLFCRSFVCCGLVVQIYFFIYLLTYLRTSWCRVALEKLTGLQLFKRFPAFHWTWRFITALTSVHHLSILGQPHPVHIPTSHLLEIHPNIHPSAPRSTHWSLSFWFPHQDPIHPSLLTHTCHMPSPSRSSRFYHPHNIGWGVQII